MESQWLYQRGGRQYGPVSTAQLQALAAAGELAPIDMVWTDGMGDWMPAERAGGIFPDDPQPQGFQAPAVQPGMPPGMGQPMQGGAPPMGQPPAGQPPMGQAPMGQAPMGQPPMGQPPMGQAPMGQAPMGQPPMGQDPMGQAPMGQPVGQAPVAQPVDQPPMGQPVQPEAPAAGQPIIPQQPVPPQQQVPQAPAGQQPGQPLIDPLIPPSAPAGDQLISPKQPVPDAPAEEPKKKKKKKKTEWYFMKNGNRCGPISSAHLKERAASGKLKRDDMIWREGLDDWIKAKTVQGVVFPKGPPPAPEAPKPTSPGPVIPTGGSNMPDLAGPPAGAPTIDDGSKSDKKKKGSKKKKGKAKPKSEPKAKKKKAKKEDAKKSEKPAMSEEERQAKIEELQGTLAELRKKIVAAVLAQSDDLLDISAVSVYVADRTNLEKEIDEIGEKTEQLRTIRAELAPDETAWRELSDELAQTDEALKSATEKLGKTAFDGWIDGSIPDHDIFAKRLEVHQDIMDLEQKRERTESKMESGKIDEAKGKSECEDIAAKLGALEAKITPLNTEIGKVMIASPDLVELESEATAAVTSEIENLKTKAKDLRPKVDQNLAILEATKNEVAEKFRIKIESADSLASEVEQGEKRTEAKQQEIATLDEEFPERLLADKYAPDEGEIGDLLDAYEDADEELKELKPPGSIFGGLSTGLGALLAMFAAIWGGLKGWQKIVGLVVVVAIVGALVWFLFLSGGTPATPETPAGDPATTEPTADGPVEIPKTQEGIVTAPVPAPATPPAAGTTP